MPPKYTPTEIIAEFGPMAAALKYAERQLGLSRYEFLMWAMVALHETATEIFKDEVDPLPWGTLCQHSADFHAELEASTREQVEEMVHKELARVVADFSAQRRRDT